MNLTPIRIPMKVAVSDTTIPMKVSSDSETVSMKLGAAYEISVPEIYEGSYEVIPKAYDEQILPTKDKYLTDDVSVKRVPYYQTSNEYGDTVYIALEVN